MNSITITLADAPTLTTKEQKAEDIFQAIQVEALTKAWAVERIGTWVWVSKTDFKDKEGRDLLKSKGLKWSGTKKAWYWMDKENQGRRSYAKNLEQVRSWHDNERLA